MSRLATHNRNRHSRRGFTLVEVLIALVVLLVGVYAIFAIFPRGYSAMEASQMRVTAAQLAEAELARWRLTPEAIPDQIVATDYTGKLIAGTLVGTRNVNGNAGTAASMLLVWNLHAMPLAGSQNFRTAALDDKTFVGLDRLRGALYSPEDLTSCEFDPVSRPGEAYLHPNWQPDSLYLPRTVIGEQVDITRLPSQPISLPDLSTSTLQPAGVPFYLLSHAPLDVLRYEKTTVTSPMGPPGRVWMDVYEAQSWTYVAPANPVTLGDHEFTYNPSEKKLYFGPIDKGVVPPEYQYQRIFKVDYTALQTVLGPGNTPTTSAVRIYGLTVSTVPTGGVALKPLDYPPASELTFRVFEKLRLLTDTEYSTYLQNLVSPALPQWPRNAYYIKPGTSRVTGMIEFCPLLQTDPKPTDITHVKVDYRVLDWQILVFDVEVPTSGEVHLPIAHLKGPGYLNPPRQQRAQELARGIRQFFKPDPVTGEPVLQDYAASDSRTWAYVIAVDRQNGDILTDIDRNDLSSLTDQLSSSPYDRRTRVRVDFRNGILYFNYWPTQVPKGTYNPNIDTPNRSGRTYRVFCRSEGDWGVQLLPAARVYARSTTNRPDGAPVGGGGAGALLAYSWRKLPPNVPPQVQAAARQIYFPLSEIGQSVAVDYYRDNGTFIEGEIHTIGGPQVTDLRCWVGALSEPLRYMPNGLGPINVRGISVRARVVWSGKGRTPTLLDVAQAVDTGVSRPNASLEESWYQLFSTTFIPRTPI